MSFAIDNSCPHCGSYAKGYTVNTGWTVKCVNTECVFFDQDTYRRMMEDAANGYEDPAIWDLFSDNEKTNPGV